MATLVTFHAHPDDEAIVTGGVMRKAYEEGHRVVLVIATRGEIGEIPDDLAPGETIWERRVQETQKAADLLGVARVEFLGYQDSGMMGDEPNNTAPDAFWQADVEEAATRLADVLREENARALTVYDRFGGYGHPDHLQVHRVGVRAAQLAGTPVVYQAMVNEDRFREVMAAIGEDVPPLLDGTVPLAEVTTRVDVTPYLGVKRAAMRAHASQIPEDSFFLKLDENDFAYVFGTEYFIREGHEPESELDLG